MNPASADALYEAFIEFENSKDAYAGVYCRRWGIPLIDGGTVRLPKIIGQGKSSRNNLNREKSNVRRMFKYWTL